MKNKKYNDTFTALKSIVEIGDTQHLEDTIGDKFYSSEGKIIIIREKNVRLSYEYLELLYKWCNNNELISFDFFVEQVFKKLLNGVVETVEEIKKIFDTMSISEYVFIRPLFGVILKNNKIITKGRFKFIRNDEIEDYLEDNNINLNNNKNIISTLITKLSNINFCFVEIKSFAKDKLRAKELSNANFKKLENTLRFMYGTLDKDITLSFFDAPENPVFDGIYYNAEGNITIVTNMNRKYIIPISIDDRWFFESKNGNEQIWTLLNKNSDTCSEIEKRILRAIEWVGMAMHNQEQNIAFVQYMFAIECLMKNDEGFISKSITAQIAEYIAFIVGNDLESRMEIDNLFRNLYKLRSSIAHGNNVHKHLSKEINQSLWLIKQIIIALLTRNDLESLNTVNDLKAYIDRCRYL